MMKIQQSAPPFALRSRCEQGDGETGNGGGNRGQGGHRCSPRHQTGTIVPVFSLAVLPLPTLLLFITNTPSEKWPCHTVMQQLTEEERLALFKRAGLLRFEQKTHTFVEHLRAIAPNSAYDPCLIPALAEGLGYGRDRNFFRATGLYLVGYT